MFFYVNCSAPSSGGTINYNLPFGLMSFVKPNMALRNDTRSCIDLSSDLTNRCNFLHCFAKPCLALLNYLARGANVSLL